MIKKFKEYISEGLWKSGIERSRAGTPRKEDGVKVKTILGVDINLKDPTIDYDRIIKMITDRDYDSIEYEHNLNTRDGLTPNDVKLIKNGEHNYYHLFKNTNNDEEFLLSLYDYNTFIRHTGVELGEDDYNSICRSIAEVIRINEVNFMLNEYGDGSVDGITYLMSVDDDDWVSDEIIKMYVRNFRKQFPESRLPWVIQDKNGTDIGLSFNLDAIVNYKKYKEFTEDWFTKNKNNI